MYPGYLCGGPNGLLVYMTTRGSQIGAPVLEPLTSKVRRVRQEGWEQHLQYNIYHATVRMLVAVGRRLDTLNVVCWIRCAGDMRAMLFANVYHVMVSVRVAVSPELTALDIEDRRHRAGHMCTTPVNDVYPPILRM